MSGFFFIIKFNTPVVIEKKKIVKKSAKSRDMWDIIRILVATPLKYCHHQFSFVPWFFKL